MSLQQLISNEDLSARRTGKSFAGKWFLLLALFLYPGVLSSAEPASPGAPNPGVPELITLQRFAGNWEAKVPNSEDSIASKRIWILDGYFLKHDFELAGGSLRGTIYRGYDRANRRYTLTFLDSQGNVSLLAGHWNEDLKTMTFEAVSGACPIRRYESQFPDDDTEAWTIRFESDGQQVEVSGTAQRQLLQ